MNKQLIIVRHGNTFLPNQTPTRVGGELIYLGRGK